MPTKSTKITTKSESKKSKWLEKKSESKVLEKKNVEKKESTKKVVVKRRKTDLKPTKASAVAIVSQANRAKKQALIDKVSNSNVVPVKTETSDGKIPLWVWIFFGCSLLLFCVSFYQAIIRPQIENENVVVDESVNWIDENVESGWNYQELENENEAIALENDESKQVELQGESQWLIILQTANDVIVEFFNRLSNRNFDWAFDLMTPALRGYADIRSHFSSVRMNPFFDWIEWWKVVLENIQYIKSPSYWKDVYNFDLSYVLESNQEKYEETWEFGVNTAWEEPKISSIRCISSKCSYHPIFWPENFGLMR